MKEEQSQILLEEIIKGIEDLKKNFKRPEGKSDPGSDASRLLGIIENIEDSIITNNYNLNNMGNRFSTLTETINGFAPVNKTLHHHNHVILPGLLKWLELIKKGVMIYTLTILLSISIAMSFYWYNLQEKYELGYYKFNSALLLSVDILQVDTVYKDNEKYIKTTIDSIIANQEKQKEIRSQLENINKKESRLAKELNELKTKRK